MPLAMLPASLIILEFVERSGAALLADSPPAVRRTLYESVRDAAWRHLSLPEQLSSGVSAAPDVERVRRATLRALGCMLVDLDCRATDVRLFRTHVQFLLNLLNSPTTSPSEMQLAAEALECVGWLAGGRSIFVLLTIKHLGIKP